MTHTTCKDDVVTIRLVKDNTLQDSCHAIVVVELSFEIGLCKDAFKEDGTVIGSISAVKLDENINAAEIGYCLGRAYWGRGIMPEALRAVMDYLFDEAEVNRIAAYHDVNNPRSGRVMQKAGMQYEGTHRQAGKNNRGICDLVCYAALRSDFRTA
jgi:RimJ/RimL family protein N-acetyltransferase